MAQKGLFFNAFPNPEYETGYDRNYSADDISDWLRAVITTGIFKSDNIPYTGEPQCFKITASGGMNIQISTGLACIKGKPFILDATHTSKINTAPTSGTRYDCITIRYNNQQSLDGRKIGLSTRRLDHVPQVSDFNRTDPYYELCIGYVEVRANVTSIQQADIHDLRGDAEFCPWITAVKGYEDYYDAIVQRFESNVTMASTGTYVQTTLASSLYNGKYSLISVYTNGLKEEDSNYEVDTSNANIGITFANRKNAGTNVSVILNNFLDGEGLSNVLDDYNQWVSQVTRLTPLLSYVYHCNGEDDNVQLSTLVKNFISDDPTNDGILKIEVIGNFGWSAPANGDGSASSPYEIFDFGNSTGRRKFLLDFSNCSIMYLSGYAGKTTILFAGGSGQIVNANVMASITTANSSIKGFSDDSRWLVKGCSFHLVGYQDTILAYCGTFENCKAIVYNLSGGAWCFYPRVGKLLRVVGGEYVAYTGDSSAKSAMVGQNQAGNSIFIGVSAPNATYLPSGAYQTNAIVHTAGKMVVAGLASSLTIEKASSGFASMGIINLSLPEETW